MTFPRRDRVSVKVTAAGLVILIIVSMAPLLLLVINRDPSLTPFSDLRNIQGKLIETVPRSQKLPFMQHAGYAIKPELQDSQLRQQKRQQQHQPNNNQTILGNTHIQRPKTVTETISQPVLKDTIGNYELRVPAPTRSGPGENGRPVTLLESESDMYEQSYKEYGFNIVISDRISMDRSVPDIRESTCKYWHYPEKLPNSSVVVVFHNEGWSTLLRTIHSIINMTPSRLLHEIVMVDDFSVKDHLKKPLDDYITQPKFQGKVKLFRNAKRDGLIRSRVTGAQLSTGEVIVFLDAHCECNVNWLPPILAEIAANRKVVVCPTVDAVEADTFAYGPQMDGLCRGAFNWEFWYKRIHVTHSKDRIGMKYSSQPYESPVMAGGLFAIDRSYFFELGGYDPGLQIWGGENFEISFKIWMCGGRLKFIPCSRVGHIYRKGVPYSYPDLGTGVSVVRTNYMRVAEVWLDEYKKYFYANQPQLRGKPMGNITDQVNFRRQHCDKSFDWFMHEVAFDTLEKFPPPPVNRLWGEIRGIYGDLCLDTLGRDKSEGILGASLCHGLGGNQQFRLNVAGELAIYSLCLLPAKGRVTIHECSKVSTTNVWDFDEGTGQIRAKTTNDCIDLDVGTFQVSIEPCHPNVSSQQFKIAPPKPR